MNYLEQKYIHAFLKSNIVKRIVYEVVTPILLCIILLACSSNKVSKTDSLIVQETVVVENIEPNSLDSLDAALSRIQIVDDGIGTNADLMTAYNKEKESWLTEISLVENRIRQKIVNKHPELLKSFIEYRESWQDLLTKKRNFATKYIETLYPFGESVFSTIILYREHYKNELEELHLLDGLDGLDGLDSFD
jgi:hypothetical protein